MTKYTGPTFQPPLIQPLQTQGATTPQAPAQPFSDTTQTTQSSTYTPPSQTRQEPQRVSQNIKKELPLYQTPTQEFLTHHSQGVLLQQPHALLLFKTEADTKGFAADAAVAFEAEALRFFSNLTGLEYNQTKALAMLRRLEESLDEFLEPYLRHDLINEASKFKQINGYKAQFKAVGIELKLLKKDEIETLFRFITLHNFLSLVLRTIFIPMHTQGHPTRVTEFLSGSHDGIDLTHTEGHYSYPVAVIVAQLAKRLRLDARINRCMDRVRVVIRIGDSGFVYEPHRLLEISDQRPLSPFISSTDLRIAGGERRQNPLSDTVAISEELSSVVIQQSLKHPALRLSLQGQNQAIQALKLLLHLFKDDYRAFVDAAAYFITINQPQKSKELLQMAHKLQPGSIEELAAALSLEMKLIEPNMHVACAHHGDTQRAYRAYMNLWQRLNQIERAGARRWLDMCQGERHRDRYISAGRGIMRRLLSEAYFVSHSAHARFLSLNPKKSYECWQEMLFAAQAIDHYHPEWATTLHHLQHTTELAINYHEQLKNYEIVAAICESILKFGEIDLALGLHIKGIVSNLKASQKEGLSEQKRKRFLNNAVLLLKSSAHYGQEEGREFVARKLMRILEPDTLKKLAAASKGSPQPPALTDGSKWEIIDS